MGLLDAERLNMDRIEKIGADRLAYECAHQIVLGRIGARSGIGDALLDYLKIGQPDGCDSVPEWMSQYEAFNATSETEERSNNVCVGCVGMAVIEAYSRENERVSGKSQTTCSAWVETSKELPPLGQMVWCFEDGNVWLGSREDSDNEGWLWTQCYNHFWWNGKKYDGDFEADDDYRPTRWALVPEPPNA